MSADDQKLLALEMAKCHLHEMDMPLFDDESCAARLTEETLPSCLPSVTPLGAITYTQFLTSVTESCTRLVLEELSLQQQKSANYLTQVVEDASANLHSLAQQQIEAHRRSQEEQAEQAKAFWEGQERQWQHYEAELQAQLVTHHAQLGVVMSQILPILDFFGDWNVWNGLFSPVWDLSKSLLWLMLQLVLLVWITIPRRCNWVRKKLMILAILGLVINEILIPSLVIESVLLQEEMKASKFLVDRATTVSLALLYLVGWIRPKKLDEHDHHSSEGIDRQALDEHLLAVRKAVRDELTTHRGAAPEHHRLYPVFQQIPAIQPSVLPPQPPPAVVTPHQSLPSTFWREKPTEPLALMAEATEESTPPTAAGLPGRATLPSTASSNAATEEVEANTPASPVVDTMAGTEEHPKRPLETDEDSLEEEDDRPSKKQRKN